MRIIAIEYVIGSPTKEDYVPNLKTETLRVLEIQQLEILREIYFKAERLEAVLILECEGPEEARQALDSLLLVQAGLINFETIPLRPYPGYMRLIQGELD